MRSAELIEDVRRRSGIEDEGRAALAIAAVISVLGSALTGADADALAQDLPAPFADRLRRSAGGAELVDAHELYERVASRAGTILGLAVEETQVVLQVLAENCNGEALIRARKHLPPDVAALLSRRSTETEPPPRPRPPDAPPIVHSTLSRGRPGSSHPLSEASPGYAHEHSVARNVNPHRDSKLSSARR
jgi:uncharacterized protein (DUF2267 family)